MSRVRYAQNIQQRQVYSLRGDIMTTQRNSKRLVPPPKHDREHPYKLLPRITPNLRARIVRYYERQQKEGGKSEDILEELGEEYGRSTRQIQRYISQARGERAKAEGIKRGGVGNASYVEEARKRHNEDICQLIQQWKEQLVAEIPASSGIRARYEPIFPVRFTKKDNIPDGYLVKGALHWYVGKDGIVDVWFSVEQNPIFPCLKSHLPSKELWLSFEKLKQKLAEGIMQAASTDKVRGVFVSDAIQLSSTVADELTIALAKRVFPGKCKACPAEL